jgi:phosphate/sulfate permease
VALQARESNTNGTRPVGPLAAAPGAELLLKVLMARVLTLPAAILLSGTLYWLFRQIF